MKRYLTIAFVVLAICAIFTACSHDKDLYQPQEPVEKPQNQEQIKKEEQPEEQSQPQEQPNGNNQNQEQPDSSVQEEYNNAFEEAFGKPSEDQTWGF